MLTVQFLAIGSYAVKQQHRELHNNSHNIYAIEFFFFQSGLYPSLRKPHLPWLEVTSYPHRYSDNFSLH